VRKNKKTKPKISATYPNHHTGRREGKISDILHKTGNHASWEQKQLKMH